MKVGHVVGPHWYLHKIPRSSNMPTEAIFVDPICQSRPKMGQILCFYVLCVLTAKIWCKSIYALRMRIDMGVWIQNRLRWHKKGLKIDIFWPKYQCFFLPQKGFLAILTPNNALFPNFLLVLGILGYNLLRICMGRFLSQKRLSRALWKLLFLPQIQVLKLFWPPIPIFSPKVPSKYPHMMIGHVVGPHCYLYKVPGSLNMPIMTIFLDPTCQSWPQMSPISAKIMIYVQNLFFSQQLKS